MKLITIITFISLLTQNLLANTENEDSLYQENFVTVDDFRKIPDLNPHH